MVGPSARAASTSARLVTDFEPGTRTVASTGPVAVGAAHRSVVRAVRHAVIIAAPVRTGCPSGLTAAGRGRLARVCGRYAASRDPDDLVEEFEVDRVEVPARLEPDYNVAPTKDVYAVLTRAPRSERGPDGERSSRRAAAPVRQLRVLRWGLVPSWAKDPSIGSRLINARMETVAEKPAFRRAFAKRRCLLPADGYYEWYAPGGPHGRRRPGKTAKQPFFIRPEGRRRAGDGRALRVLARPDADAETTRTPGW